jgi:Protein of unknown function (DUF1552)
MDRTRRRLLKSLALSPAAFLLPDIRRAAAQQGGIPTRFVVVCSSHGTWWPTHLPRGVGNAPLTRDAFTLGPLHTSLAPFKDRMVVLDGLSVDSMKYQTGPGGNAHIQSQAHMLTGIPMVDPGPPAAGGISLDQIIAKAINAPKVVTKFPSMNLTMNGGPMEGGISWYAARQAVETWGDGEAAYKKLFPQPVMPTTGPDLSVEQDKSVLNFVANEHSLIANKLSKEDKNRLLQHAQSIRDLESRLALNPMRTCSSDTALKAQKAYRRYGTVADTPWGGDGPEFLMGRLESQQRNIQAAFACDLSRVAVIDQGELCPAAYGYPYPNYRGNDIHGLAHVTDGCCGDPLTDTDSANMIKAYYTKQAEVLSKMLGYLEEIKESDGKSVLDHTIVLWMQEVGRGNHGGERLPWMLFGGGGGKLKTGRFIDAHVGGKTVPHNKLLTTLANLYGANLPTVGDARISTGGLDVLNAG